MGDDPMNWLEKSILIWLLVDVVLFALWVALHGGLRGDR